MIWKLVKNIIQCKQGKRCDLESNQWFSNNQDKISLGVPLEFINLQFDKSTSIEGIIIKK
jgi:hypothetical protein